MARRQWELVVEYELTSLKQLEKFDNLLDIITGRPSSWSGCGTWSGSARDNGYLFPSEAEMLAARRRVLQDGRFAIRRCGTYR